MPSLLGMVRGIPDWNEKEKMLVHLREVPILIMDDVGAENRTGWTQENLFRIIDTRYNLALPTLIAANCSQDNLGEERVGSRILDAGMGQVVPLRAKDFRSRSPGER